ncbi:hypothetical protein P1X14_04645 [Sphingomonas sp. AOB5]|uniref:hypothetical protein n=1 Tax=Sphingomonas sp. AOB5 TaxID=3034017 RepID=UPI0023F89F51|nr:hypothetical protein [Sphingomonas sp. AOB5]MDF7774525.1 hypothetical protein [Sphingomonas sp. AOB5]
MTSRKNKSAIDVAVDNPLALLAGGVALGALVGALLPRSSRERDALAPVGKKLAERTSETVKAVKETGRAEIEGLLPNRDATKEKVSQLIENVLEATKGAAAKA